jgi:uncharacterized membrane protein
MKDVKALARELFQSELAELSEREQNILKRFQSRQKISRNINHQVDAESTLGERVADRVAAFGGSWTFIGIFALVLVFWVTGNTILIMTHEHAVDPYPFIFLNLILSMLAAVQAPVIMMSQNRQSAKDRIEAAHDYEVNLKAELEIMQLHEKLDDLRFNQLSTLLHQQERHIALLEQVLAEQKSKKNDGLA